jgi:hypothetical protein
MNIYLDIDGTLIHEELPFPKAAAGLEDFILALRPHTTYWLTTHCRDGNPERARSILKQYVREELHAEIDRIQPTVWDTLKTQGIDWSQDFVWFDNDISSYEWDKINEGTENQQVVEVNLRENPSQLIEITADLLA